MKNIGLYLVWFKHVDVFFVGTGDPVSNILFNKLMLTLGVHPNESFQAAFNQSEAFENFILDAASDEADAEANVTNWIKVGLGKEPQSYAGMGKLEDFRSKEYSNAYVDSLVIKEPESMLPDDCLCVYIWHNAETGYFYIGSGSRKTRHRHHLANLKENTHVNKKFQAVYNQNSNFEFLYIPLRSRKEAYVFEQNLIDLFQDDPKLLNFLKEVNSTRGFLGGKHSEETLKIIAEKSREFWNRPENKQRLSAMSKERYANASEEWKAEMAEKTSERMTLRYLDPEEREKSRQYILNWRAVATPEELAEHRRKINEANSTPEALAALSERTTRHWKNEEFREKVIERIKIASNRPEERLRRSVFLKDQYHNHGLGELLKAGKVAWLEDEANRVALTERMSAHNEVRKKPVIVNGVEYSSIKKASEVTGHCATYIKKLNGLPLPPSSEYSAKYKNPV